MKKIVTLAAAAFLISSVAFAHGGDGKKCGKNKAACKKEAKAGKSCCKKESNKKADEKN